MSGVRVMVVALDGRGRRVAVGPVRPINASRLCAAIERYGWQVVGVAVHVSVAGFRALARDRARRGGR